MYQEVQVTLTITADAEMSKAQIKHEIKEMERAYGQVRPKNRWDMPRIDIIDIKEEAEIYGNH